MASRWGKNIVVPLDTSKENTNRPTVTHSLGTMGKWGKMGFTSTRTYAMGALPAAVAAAAAAVSVTSPQKNPTSQNDYDFSATVFETQKPRKFFKSRNTAPPEVIAQIIQQLPRQSTSPPRDLHASYVSINSMLNTPIGEPIKVKISKSNAVERKKKSPKKIKQKHNDSGDECCDIVETKIPSDIVKIIKKKKLTKELKPEAPPSRVLSRTRKTVNYCEDDEEDRLATIKDIISHRQRKTEKVLDIQETPPPTPAHKLEDIYAACDTPEPALPPPAAPQTVPIINNNVIPIIQSASKTPEHPPIVLRISKGTSRLVSSDSEEQPNASTPPSQYSDNYPINILSETNIKSDQSSIEGTSCHLLSTPKIIVKPPKPPTPLHTPQVVEDTSEINYCTVKISPDKPPKERLKLIIKTDVIRNALAAAAAAAVSKSTSGTERTLQETGWSGNEGHGSDRSEKEKSKKNKKHKHLKHVSIEQSTQSNVIVEFKTPSPHLALGANNNPEYHQLPPLITTSTRAVISPAALSERDFDSQSSVLGSISSKGNSTPLGLPPPHEESCVLHSRGSSVITSDLETSQHSSLVAPPSDIELRLESMMMDGEASEQPRILSNYIESEPLQEDILAVLRGDESEMEIEQDQIKENGDVSNPEFVPSILDKSDDISDNILSHRTMRGRIKTNYTEEKTDESDVPIIRSTRNRKSTYIDQPKSELFVQKRITRRSKKTSTDQITSEVVENNEEELEDLSNNLVTFNKTEFENQNKILNNRKYKLSKSGTINKSKNNLMNSSNVNNNINKIAASLSAKAGAAGLHKNIKQVIELTVSAPRRSYGRKRKNQQVTQVLQPKFLAELGQTNENATPAKQANICGKSSITSLKALSTSSISHEIIEPNNADSCIHTLENTNIEYCHSSSPELPDNNSMDSNSLPDSGTPLSPPRSDYLIKDKFKRTLTLDTQVGNSEIARDSSTSPVDGQNSTSIEPVKLVISKKKGSIFKSRVPSEQADLANSKRHLYRHRWDATANGDTGCDSNILPVTTCSDNHSKSVNTINNSVDSIYNDFNSDETRSSPLLGLKSNRMFKSNSSTTAHFSIPNEKMDLDTSAELTRSEHRNKSKDFYTVVSNVKTAHQIQEIGEYQEMDDDVEYILDALQPHNPLSTRCLSALQLATKCMVPAFRMHVRAHGIVTKFFKALSDANQDLSLGLCTTAIMYILSQEGLNMDLDRDALELMMNLLESEQSVAAPADHANYERNKTKVRELCEDIKAQGKATHLNVESITVGTLAMETLLSLTSKRAGDWFKEELRELGGLEHIIKTINECSRATFNNQQENMNINWTQPLLDNIKTIERCLRVLENVTQMNEENQGYILIYGQGQAINTVCSLLTLCERELILHTYYESSGRNNVSIVIGELLIPLMKVLINLTHPFKHTNTMGAEQIGQRPEVIQICLHLLLQAGKYIPDRCVFELSILALLMLINLTTYTKENRARIMQASASLENNKNVQIDDAVTKEQSQPAIAAIMNYFYKCEELARLVEKNTDAFLDNQEKNKKKQEEVDETVNNLLQKAGHHMEHSLKGSYTAILIGHVITDNEKYEMEVRKYLHGNGFKEIINVLEKYYNFMNLTASSEASVVAHIKSTKKLLDYFKKRDLLHEINADDDDVLAPLNLETLQHENKDDSLNLNHKTINKINNGNTNSSTTTPRVYKTYSQR